MAADGVFMQDDYMQDPWKTATGFDHLCSLNAEWLEGSGTTGLCQDQPDAETLPLVGILAEANRAGFLTMCSQPGEPHDEEGNAQRAFVDGYARGALARRLAALGLETDLIVDAYPPGTFGDGVRIPISLYEFYENTWGGGHCAEIFPQYLELLSPAAADELSDSWFITLIDPCWGRIDYLWDRLREVLRGRQTPYLAEPHPQYADGDEDPCPPADPESDAPGELLRRLRDLALAGNERAIRFALELQFGKAGSDGPPVDESPEEWAAAVPKLIMEMREIIAAAEKGAQE